MELEARATDESCRVASRGCSVTTLPVKLSRTHSGCIPDGYLMLALERLSPLERAAFLLHDVFGLDFEEIGATIRRDPAACRQLAARARIHVREAGPRFQVDKQRGLELAESPRRATAT